MSFEPLPHHIEQGVKRFAQQQHISHDEAVRKLLATALELTNDGPQIKSVKQKRIVVDVLHKIEVVRAERAAELAELSVRDEAVGGLIGLLEEEPEVIAAIRQANRERRQAMYES